MKKINNFKFYKLNYIFYIINKSLIYIKIISKFLTYISNYLFIYYSSTYF